MLEGDHNPPRISAASYGSLRNAAEQWEMDIRWRFENIANITLYLLVDQPVTTTIADPLILNHAAFGPNSGIGVNAEPDFEIAEILPKTVLERSFTYHLSLPETLGELTVIGRFGFSYEIPDSVWIEQQNRSKVARWVQYADSEAISMKLLQS